MLVLGNGFDLANSLKTSYQDFIGESRKYKDTKSSSEEIEDEYLSILNDNGFMEYFFDFTEKVAGWVDVEYEIKRIILCIGKFINKDIEFKSNGSVNEVIGENKLTRDILLNFKIFSPRVYKLQNKCIIESKYYNSKYGINKLGIISKLESELNLFIRCLELYLSNIMEEKTVEVDSFLNKQITVINPLYVVSFNYTDTYKWYGIKREDVFHIHGKIGENNIVLGIDDEDETNLDFISFKKYFQRIQKLTGFLDTEKFMRLDEYGNHEYRDVYFYGHFLDVTDKETIMWIKEHSGIMYIYYLDNGMDYKQKVINLIAILGKERVMEMIQREEIKFLKIE